MKNVILARKRLKQVVQEMQQTEQYYSYPENKYSMLMLPRSKQDEWISRLLMIAEELKG